MKIIIILPLIVISSIAVAQSDDESSIRKILDQQTISWNRADIEGFMAGYWKDDSLMFIGKNGITWGWQKTLNNYKKSYPDSTTMGKLAFDITIVKKLSPEYYYVVGKWTLARSIGNLSGYYNLLFKKINGQWFIIADHSS
jgi:hypothetical protein